jgi:hypothetical protein
MELMAIKEDEGNFKAEKDSTPPVVQPPTPRSASVNQERSIPRRSKFLASLLRRRAEKGSR